MMDELWSIAGEVLSRAEPVPGDQVMSRVKELNTEEIKASLCHLIGQEPEFFPTMYSLEMAGMIMTYGELASLTDEVLRGMFIEADMFLAIFQMNRAMNCDWPELMAYLVKTWCRLIILADLLIGREEMQT